MKLTRGRCFLAGHKLLAKCAKPPEIEIPTSRAASAIGRDKRDANLFLTSAHPTLSFDFEIGKIVKYAGLNSDQLDLIFGKNLARLLRIEPNRPPRKPWTSRKSDDEKSRYVLSVGAEKMDWLISRS